MSTKIQKVNLVDKYALFNDHWNPRIIGELNGQLVKIAKVKDEFVWHSHEVEDEMFMVFKGTLFIDFREETLEIREGEMVVVPRGVEHRPRTNGEEVHIILFEPRTTVNTGETDCEKTRTDLERI